MKQYHHEWKREQIPQKFGLKSTSFKYKRSLELNHECDIYLLSEDNIIFSTFFTHINYMTLNLTKHRCKSDKFKQFSQCFKHALSQIIGKDLSDSTEPNLCTVYEGLNRSKKTQALEMVAQMMSLDRKQILKHYSNCFTKCKYSALSKNVKTVIEMWVYNFMQTKQEGKPLQLVLQFLKNNEIERFPCSVQAYAQKTKDDIQKGVYKGAIYSHEMMTEYLNKVKHESEEQYNQEINQFSIQDLDLMIPQETKDFLKHYDESSKFIDTNNVNDQQELIDQLAMILVNVYNSTQQHKIDIKNE